jgi:hypothetical protein
MTLSSVGCTPSLKDMNAVFFRRFLELHAPAGTRIYTYRCDGKSKVFEAFEQITARKPAVQAVLFFVDKDLDDILGTPWPTDPRIFVTDVYSIENYLVTRDVLAAVYQDTVRLAGIDFDDQTVLDQFDRQLERFHDFMLVVMAWIVTTRRNGDKPNLNNLDFADLFESMENCDLKRKRLRLTTLGRKTGVKPGSVFRRVSSVTKELARLDPKRFMRGKFEALFFLEFWRQLTKQLRDLAAEAGGKATIRPSLERSTLVATLTPYVAEPRSLRLFLEAHFPLDVEPTTDPGPKGFFNWLFKKVR